MGDKINTSEPGEQSPPDEIECPEDCPLCAKSRSPDDCKGYACIYDMGPETADDEKFHTLRDEGKLDRFGRKNEEEEL